MTILGSGIFEEVEYPIRKSGVLEDCRGSPVVWLDDDLRIACRLRVGEDSLMALVIELKFGHQTSTLTETEIAWFAAMFLG
jgi:hypothetical protein